MKYAAPIYVITIIVIAIFEFITSPEASRISDIYEDPSVVLKPLETLHFKQVSIFD